jgi:hypothetical protein
MTTQSITNHERAAEQRVSRLLSEPKTKTQTAIEYFNNGLSVIPTYPTKKAALQSWKLYQTQLPAIQEISKWWYGNDHSIGVICGQVSGGIECIDFDEKYNIGPTPMFEKWKALVERDIPGLFNRLVIQRTQNKGYHAIYRCESVGGNQKLASRATTEDERKKNPNEKSVTLIETRGEGGYFLAYPSNGYALCNGSFQNIPRITPQERDILIECACALNEYIEPNTIQKVKGGHQNGNRPGDVFNRTGDHRMMLEKNGWQLRFEDNVREQWTRPGKTDGYSANYHKDLGLFYVWSSNASPLLPGKAYTKFTLYTALEANGDYSTAAKQLSAEGYGVSEAGVASGTTIMKIEEKLSEQYEFRKNIITSRTEYRNLNDDTFLELTDYKLNSIYIELLKQDIKTSKDTVAQLLNSEFVENYDPFVSYFENLPAWDGVTDYIGILAKTVKLESANENNLFKHNLRKWLIGVVACAIEPNHINQTMVVLVGEQGIGKGRWLKKLMPLSLSRYYFEGIIKTDNKDTLVNLSECLLINLDELETLNKTDIGELKSLITRTSVKVRRPYDRLQEDLPRRASFVGSVNPTDFLNDPTGTRRFLAFQVKSVNLEAMPNMDLVFAQAYALYRQGVEWWFNEKEIGAINSRNMKFSAQGYEEQLILSMYEKPESGKGTWMTSTEIAQSLSVQFTSFKIDRQSVRNIGLALTKHGFASKRPGNVKTYKILLKK